MIKVKLVIPFIVVFLLHLAFLLLGVKERSYELLEGCTIILLCSIIMYRSKDQLVSAIAGFIFLLESINVIYLELIDLSISL